MNSKNDSRSSILMIVGAFLRTRNIRTHTHLFQNEEYSHACLFVLDSLLLRCRQTAILDIGKSTLDVGVCNMPADQNR